MTSARALAADEGVDREASDPSAPGVGTTEPDQGERRGRRSRAGGRAALALVAVLGIAFLVHASPWLAAPFGESHDGRNAAVWGLASQALIHDPVGSRLGGRPPAGADAYAHHPPLIIWETALAESLAGKHRIVTRSPAWIGSVVSLGLLSLLLLDAGLDPVAATCGTLIAFGSGMFLTYGTMLDTPVTSLPFILLVLLGWQRARQRRPWPPWTVGLIGALAALSGWEALAISIVAAAWLAGSAHRGRARPSQAAALGGGLAVAFGLTVAWIIWVYGSLGPLFTRLDGRAGGITMTSAVSHSLDHARDLLPWALPIGAVAAVLSWRLRPGRDLLIVTLMPLLAYDVAFHTAAWIHDYWNFLLLLPLAIATARGVQAIVDARLDVAPARLAGGLCAVACLPLVLALARPSLAQQRVENGLAAGRLAELAGARHPGPGPKLGFVNLDDSRVDSLGYESGWAAELITSRADLATVARRQPDLPVIVSLANPGRSPRLRAHAIAVDGDFALVSASDAYGDGVAS